MSVIHLSVMDLDDFIEKVERERPEQLGPEDLVDVHPKPWVNRAGSGSETRIRMQLGRVHYQREHGDPIWYRSDIASEFDTETS